MRDNSSHRNSYLNTPSKLVELIVSKLMPNNIVVVVKLKIGHKNMAHTGTEIKYVCVQVYQLLDVFC